MITKITENCNKKNDASLKKGHACISHREIQINATHITLPSGNQLALDAQNSFTPNQEFWQLWNEDKLTVKQAGIAVTRERGEWRGYVRSTGNGFSYSQSELHQLWVAKARELAEGEPVPPVMLPVKTLPKNIRSRFPCFQHSEHEVIAKVCRNDTFQLRLWCESCKRQTPAAIKWEHFSSDVIIRAIARALQSKTHDPKMGSRLFDEVREVDSWV